jgi:hypothetical protein
LERSSFSHLPTIGENKTKFVFALFRKENPFCEIELEDVPLNEKHLNDWLAKDELQLIEMIETCGLPNWIDIGMKLQRNVNQCEKHFPKRDFSSGNVSYSIAFHSSHPRKLLHGEDPLTSKNFHRLHSSSIIYRSMSINSDQHKSFTSMPYRDESEREYLNRCETCLPTQIHLDDEETSSHFFDQQQFHQRRCLLDQAK